ncbi:MAG TPA: metallophosphoesterase [Anaerolineales bacterium]|nr:metallophosphoesterase [Anaerolineales bacterium]
MSKMNKSMIRGTALGMTIGAAAVIYRNHMNRKHPLRTPAQLRISRALDRALRYARQENNIGLNENSRYIIFSDHHKGARDIADDFQPCEITYQTALDYYYDNGFTLVLLGDVEELWENPIQPVMDAYENIFTSEARFFPDRYIRVIGNHDDAWNEPASVVQYLEPFYPKIQVQQGIVLEYDNSRVFGELFLAHGHQGTLDSDYLSGISPQLLPVYRQLQNRFQIGRTTPATDDFLRGEHDTQMYRWASQKRKLIFISGHTHRPVWSSLTHLDQLYMQLFALRSRQKEFSKSKYEKQYLDLLHSINKRIIKDPPVNEILKTTPSYFNTGCCRFSDGDVTGIEITAHTISLVKWDKKSLQRMESISMPLEELFALL